MFIAKTPLRISFCGGGSDMENYYSKSKGCVLAWTIDKYVYAFSNQRFEDEFKIIYSKVEVVKNLNDIINKLAKNTLKFMDIKSNFELSTISDIPGGSGLGSSSAYVISLLKTISSFKKEQLNSYQLAEYASNIEINLSNEPIGKQDQYACAFGGLNYFEFYENSVQVNKINVSKEFQNDLENHLILVYTGVNRHSGDILKEQQMNNNYDHLKELVKSTEMLYKNFYNEDHSSLGAVLHNNWMLKKQFASNITNSNFDKFYLEALNFGAEGGKILGAGGGGFFLFYVKPNNKSKFIEFIDSRKLKILDFKFSNSSPEAIEI
jgi:D-glycero-alpha-D-manno-heptose-7-phosphate kinase